jgi:hypothetical protein
VFLSCPSTLEPAYSVFGAFAGKLTIQISGHVVDRPSDYPSSPARSLCQSRPPPDFRPDNIEYRSVNARVE